VPNKASMLARSGWRI